MSVTATYATSITVVETLEDHVDGLGATIKRQVTHDAFNTTSVALSPATKVASFIQLLTANSATISLRVLDGAGGGTVDGNGLKVQAIKFQALSTNANPITIGDGAATGYELAGDGWKVVLNANQEFVFRGNESTPDIGDAAKNIDLSGTDEQGVNVIVVMG